MPPVSRCLIVLNAALQHLLTRTADNWRLFSDTKKWRPTGQTATSFDADHLQMTLVVSHFFTERMCLWNKLRFGHLMSLPIPQMLPRTPTHPLAHQGERGGAALCCWRHRLRLLLRLIFIHLEVGESGQPEVRLSFSPLFLVFLFLPTQRSLHFLFFSRQRVLTKTGKCFFLSPFSLTYAQDRHARPAINDLSDDGRGANTTPDASGELTKRISVVIRQGQKPVFSLSVAYQSKCLYPPTRHRR